MQLQNKYKIFLSLMFSFLVFFCFCQSTQAKSRSIIIPPPNPIRPVGNKLILASKIIFEWQKVNIPPEYSLKYFILEVTPNINARGGDFSHGLSLKVIVDGNYTRFPPTGDGYEVTKLALDKNSRFSWRVQAIYNCGEEEEHGQFSINSTSPVGMPMKLELYDLYYQFSQLSPFSTNDPKKEKVKQFIPLENDETPVCILQNGYPMVNLAFIRLYLGCEKPEIGYKDGLLDYLTITRYGQKVTIFRNKLMNVLAVTVDSDLIKNLKLYDLKKQFDPNCPSFYFFDETNIYVSEVVLKWIGVNNTYYDTKNKVFQICDQGLNENFAVYSSSNPYPKGRYYIVPGSYSKEGTFTINSSSINPLTYRSGEFKIWCVGTEKNICNDYCNGQSILRLELLRGLAKIIHDWEQSGGINGYKSLKIDGSYRCKEYNSSVSSYQFSAHQCGLKFDIDCRDSNEAHCTTFRDWVINTWSLSNKDYGLSYISEYKQHTNPTWTEVWADIRYQCGTNGPYYNSELDTK
jgi:hypothetical protein